MMFKMRSIPTPPFCSTCTTVPEDCIHLLRDCPRATSLWNTMPIKQDFFFLDLHSWLHHNLMYEGVKDGPLTTLPWPTLFSFCLWNIWLRRNEMTFTTSMTPLHIWRPRLMYQTWEFFTSLPCSTPYTPPAQPVLQQTHCPNPIGWTTVKTDGSWSSKDFSAGIGGYFSDQNIKWKHGFHKRLSTKDPFTTELAAILEALQQ